MAQTFVATPSIRRLKPASRQEISPSRQAVKRMRRDGASEQRQTSTVQVIRIGKALQHRTSSDGGGKWTKQYVPAYDELRVCVPPKVIGPYIASSADAPWLKTACVYLLVE